MHPGEGWTETVITPGPRRARGRRAAHRAGTSPRRHTSTCSKRSPVDALVDVSYDAALAEGYLWHEFGDVHLILPLTPLRMLGGNGVL